MRKGGMRIILCVVFSFFSGFLLGRINIYIKFEFPQQKQQEQKNKNQKHIAASLLNTKYVCSVRFYHLLLSSHPCSYIVLLTNALYDSCAKWMQISYLFI